MPSPTHIAIIMDGNGRWAKARGMPRAFGHREGVKAVRRTVSAAADLGIKALTLFSFSTENWRRPADEVSAILDLLRSYVRTDLDDLVERGVRVRVIGERVGLAEDVRGIVEEAEGRSRHNRAFDLFIAFNYGGRDEIVRAARRMAAAVAAGACDPFTLDEAGFGSFLDAPDAPPPDIVVRTSGEQRLSNFLLWQAAYAELVFLDVLWPDFDRPHLEAAIAAYHARERRFGGVAHVEQS